MKRSIFVVGLLLVWGCQNTNIATSSLTNRESSQGGERRRFISERDSNVDLSIERASVNVSALTDPEDREKMSRLIQWAKDNPEAIKNLESLNLSLTELTSQNREDVAQKIRKSLKNVRITLPQEELQKSIKEFKEHLSRRNESKNGNLNGSESKKETRNYNTLAVYSNYSGVPFYGDGDSAYNNYRSYAATSCLPIYWAPKVYQTSPESCGIAAWAFADGSWSGKTSAQSQTYYASMKVKYYDSGLFGLQQYFGLSVGDLVSAMRAEGNTLATNTRGNNITSLMGAMDGYRAPIIAMENGNDLSDGSHYVCAIGYDSQNIVLSNSIQSDSNRTIHMPISTFVPAWRMLNTQYYYYNLSWVYLAAGFTWYAAQCINMGDDLNSCMIKLKG